ncbi:MAG: hypothetical protein Q8R96_17190 [Bacteroidota bacterium]|nr:hypothetical protein [Bacteroidota bacterium]
MKDKSTALKGLKISALKIQPLQGCDFNFIFPTGFTGGYSNFIPSGFSELAQLRVENQDINS